jgi:hypothetical protein
MAFPAVIYIIDKDDEHNIKPVGGDVDAEGITVLVKYYNPSTLAWERGKQPTLELTGDLTVTLGDVERLLADQYYKRMKPYGHASGRPKYVCRNTDIDANETDTDWFCWKYSDADLPEIEGPRQGAVNTEGTVDALFA